MNATLSLIECKAMYAALRYLVDAGETDLDARFLELGVPTESLHHLLDGCTRTLTEERMWLPAYEDVCISSDDAWGAMGICIVIFTVGCVSYCWMKSYPRMRLAQRMVLMMSMVLMWPLWWVSTSYVVCICGFHKYAQLTRAIGFVLYPLVMYATYEYGHPTPDPVPPTKVPLLAEKGPEDDAVLFT